MFEVVISAYFRQEDVHQYVNKVHCHPLVVAETSYIYRFFFQILAHDVAHRTLKDPVSAGRTKVPKSLSRNRQVEKLL